MKVPVYSKTVKADPLGGAYMNRWGGAARSTGTNARAFGQNPFGADAFGANVGRAMEDAGRELRGLSETFGAISNRMKEERDANMVLETSTKWQKELLRFQHDPEKGLYRRQGKSAVGAYAETERFLGESVAKLRAELENEDQKEAFGRYAMQRGLALLDSVARFEARQHHAWRTETAQLALNTAIESAVANYHDGNLIQASLDEGKKALDATMTGSGAEAIGAAKAEFATRLHGEVIRRYLENDPRGAENYYKLVEDQIEGPARRAIKKEIDAGTRILRIQEKTDDLMDRFNSEGDALRWIRDNASGKDEQSLVTSVKTRFRERRMETAERRRSAAASLEKTIRESPDASSLEREMRLQGHPEERIEAMTAQYMTEKGMDEANDGDALPWETAERRLVRTARYQGAEPEQLEKILKLHNGMTEDRLKGLELDQEKAEALDGELEALGVPPRERTLALLRYAPQDEEHAARLEAELRAEAETALWKEIQAGEYDTPDGGVEGKLLLRERLGALGLGKEPSERLLKEHASRFSPDRSPERDLVRSVIAGAQETMENALTKGIFRNAALAMAERFGKESPLWKLADDILRLKEELTGDRKDLYLPQMSAWMKTPQASWEGWTWSDEDQAYIRPTGETDEKGYPKIERWNPARNIFLILP